MNDVHWLSLDTDIDRGATGPAVRPVLQVITIPEVDPLDLAARADLPAGAELGSELVPHLIEFLLVADEAAIRRVAGLAEEFATRSQDVTDALP